MTPADPRPPGVPGGCQKEARMRRTLAAVVAVATSTLAIAACSSSSSSSSTSSTGGGTSASATAAATSAGMAAAMQYEQQFLSTPTSIGITTPLQTKPPARQLLVRLDSGLGSAKVLAQDWAPAAAHTPS